MPKMPLTEYPEKNYDRIITNVGMKVQKNINVFLE